MNWEKSEIFGTPRQGIGVKTMVTENGDRGEEDEK